MVADVTHLMARHGRQMTLARGEETRAVRGFFHPISSSSWQSMAPGATVLGEVSQGQYTYLGPVEAEAREGDLLLVGGKRYLLLRVEEYCCDDTPLYQWGLCVERTEDGTWGA